MALTLALRRGAISDDLTYFLVEDSTGVYNVDTNPGGYGTPNPARTDIALYLYGLKHHADEADSALTVTGNTDPLNATSWQVGMTMDGYHYIRVVGVLAWSSATAYVVNNIVFYQNKYYIATQAGSNLDPVNNSTYWTEVTDLTTDAVYANSSVYVYQLNTVIDSRGKQCYQTQIYNKAKDDCNCNGSSPGPVVQPYMKIFVHLNAARFNCLQEKFALADAELKYLSEYCTSIGCGC